MIHIPEVNEALKCFNFLLLLFYFLFTHFLLEVLSYLSQLISQKGQINAVKTLICCSETFSSKAHFSSSLYIGISFVDLNVVKGQIMWNFNRVSFQSSWASADVILFSLLLFSLLLISAWEMALFMGKREKILLMRLAVWPSLGELAPILPVIHCEKLDKLLHLLFPIS